MNKTKLLHVIASAAKWILFGIFCGLIVGAIASAFSWGINLATSARMQFPFLIFFLPAAGLLIVLLHKGLHQEDNKGTDTVLEAAREGGKVPVRMAPFIFISTILTHLFGGSAGREGAALQLGGSLGSLLGSLLHFPKTDRRLVIMCGMSAAFSALFGTPLAAAALAMEISTVGIMYYPALIPCVISSLTAHFVAQGVGLTESVYDVIPAMNFTPVSALIVGLFAVIAALASILFCVMMNRSGRLMQKYIRNPYLRIVFGGCCVLVLTLLVGSQMYNGSGMTTIADCMNEETALMIPWYAFLLKMVFTALTLPSGYRGGEIVPSLFIGATLGAAFANITGLPAPLFASIGMGALFCGVTNCPVTALLICFEMFGFDAMPYYLLAIAIAFICSGNYGIYRGQKILFSKYEDARINENAHQ